MDMDQFISAINQLRARYQFCIEEDCDLWSLMRGFLLYREDSKKAFAHITGIRYTYSGDRLEGDFEGVLRLMTEVVESEYVKG